MKKMKLFCGILIGLMISSSCSNESDPTSDPMTIVGVWKPIKAVDICSNGNEEIFDFSTCIQMSRLTFSSDGSLNNMEYDDDTGSCVEIFSNGNWVLTSDSLSLTLDGNNSIHTFFELTNNILRKGYYDNNPTNTECSGGNLRSHYYTEYVRVE